MWTIVSNNELHNIAIELAKTTYHVDYQFDNNTNIINIDNRAHIVLTDLFLSRNNDFVEASIAQWMCDLCYIIAQYDNTLHIIVDDITIGDGDSIIIELRFESWIVQHTNKCVL